ncbi:hypothetical protein Bbelb_437810 [Branchiostoma belcheri]|nr:hypothetical protein Bbelb_437810 [Branchiostoma belcheri]
MSREKDSYEKKVDFYRRQLKKKMNRISGTQRDLEKSMVAYSQRMKTINEARWWGEKQTPGGEKTRRLRLSSLPAPGGNAPSRPLGQVEGRCRKRTDEFRRKAHDGEDCSYSYSPSGREISPSHRGRDTVLPELFGQKFGRELRHDPDTNHSSQNDTSTSSGSKVEEKDETDSSTETSSSDSGGKRNNRWKNNNS